MGKTKIRVLLLTALALWSVPLRALPGTSDTIQAENLGELIVTGTNRSMPEKLLPYTVSVVGRERLQATGSTQVLSAISGMVPSLFVTQRSIFGFGVSNGGSGHIKLRGVGGDRASGVLMMVDGQPQFAGIYSHHVSDFYDKEYVERVEVLRGPGSVLYGSNAMAGAINVITRQTASDGVRTVLTTQYGSYDTWLTSLTNTARAGKFSSLVSLSYNRTDGNIKGMDFKSADGYAKIGYDFSKQWKAYADYTLMNFRGDDPVYPRLRDPGSEAVYHQNITRGEASVTVSNSYALTSGAARVYYSYGNHYVDDPNHFHSTDNRLGALLYQNFHPWLGASATAGFDFDRYEGRIPVSGGTAHKPGSLQTMDSKHIVEYAPYLTVSQNFADNLLNVSAGVRGAFSDMFDARAIPQFGFAVNPGRGWTVKGNLAMGYRNPSFRELYLYRMANPDLEPEKMMNYELSLAKSFGRWFNTTLTAYYSKGDNIIQVVDMKNTNTGRFINKGLELTMGSQPLDNLWLSASYSFMHTSLTNLTGAPRHQYFVGADWKALKQLTVSMDLKGTGRLFVADGLPHRSYALLNAKISWETCRWVTLFVRLENITNARYEINRGYTMPGFNTLGGVRVTI